MPAAAAIILGGIAVSPVFGLLPIPTALSLLYVFSIFVIPIFLCSCGGFFGRVRSGGSDKRPEMSIFWRRCRPTTPLSPVPF